MTKKKIKTLPPVYFGHPMPFWKERLRDELKPDVNSEELKILRDQVDYDSLHLQMAIINKTGLKVAQRLREEENILEIRREKLRALLMEEEKNYTREILIRQEMPVHKVREKEDKKTEEYLEKIQREQIMACQKALEREKISRGMQCTKLDEIELRKVQKMQMEEKKQIALEEEQTDRMWHQMLLEDVRRKEQIEIMDRKKKNMEMIERRMMYDEQISSANKKISELIQAEREKENKRIESIKKRMEEDYVRVIRRKKEQQIKNKMNYQEQSINKLLKIKDEMNKDRNKANEIIRSAHEKLREEQIKRLQNMKNQQTEQIIFMEHHQLERLTSDALEKEAEKTNEELIKNAQRETDEKVRTIEAENERIKQGRADEYKRYLENKRKILEDERRKRDEAVVSIRNTAINEIKKKLMAANNELWRQLNYKDALDAQITNNRHIMDDQNTLIENMMKPFTKKATNFAAAVMERIDKSPGRKKTNPEHPFLKLNPNKQAMIKTEKLPQLRI